MVQQINQYYNNSMYDKQSLTKKFETNHSKSNHALENYNFKNSKSKQILQVYNSKELRVFNSETQNQQNKDYITRRMEEIRKKYAMNKGDTDIRNKSTNLKSAGKNIQLTNKSNQSKDTESPINWTKKVGNSAEKTYLVEYKSQTLQKDVSIKNIVNITSPCDPRIQSIDKINQKIKSILKNISNEDYKKTNQTKACFNQSQQLVKLQPKSTFQTDYKNYKKDINLLNRKTEVSKIYEYPIKKQMGQQSQSFGQEKDKFQRIKQKTNENILLKQYPSMKLKERPTSNLNSYQKQKQIQDKTKPQYQNNFKSYKSIAYQQFNSKETKNQDQISKKQQQKQKKQKIIIIQDSNYESKQFVERQNITTKDQTNKLIKCLKRQVQLDEVYRNKKYAFKEMKDPNKISNLLHSVKKLGIHITQQALLKQITISQSQYNPFYTFRDDTDYDSIAQAYKQSTNYWLNSIINKFHRQKLIQEGIKDEILGFDKKGYLTIEDFVRMLNNSSDSFYRNRDLVLIFRRLNGHEKIQFQEFLNWICIQV